MPRLKARPAFVGEAGAPLISPGVGAIIYLVEKRSEFADEKFIHPEALARERQIAYNLPMNDSRPVALVTGSGGTLGSEMCKQFLEDGYDVVVSDLREDAANEVAEKLDSTRERVLSVAIDVGSTQSVDAGIEAVVARFGRLDVLVNNAGNFKQRWTATCSDEDWRFITNVHLDGAFRCCRAAFPHLKKSPYPTIISIASIAARIGLPGRLSYSVSKAGLEALTRTLAVEWAPENIRVVAVAPGFTKSQI